MKEKTTKEVLDVLLARLHCDESNPLAKACRIWAELAGPDMAIHTRIADVRAHVLIVEADHPTWASLIMMKRKQLLARIQGQFPELQIRQLQVRTRPSIEVVTHKEI